MNRKLKTKSTHRFVASGLGLIGLLAFLPGTGCPLPLNSPPIAEAGSDRTVNERNQVTLDATASSDPDGDALTYSWRQIGQPAVALSGGGTAQPTFTAPEVTAPTTLIFEVQVNDGQVTHTDTVNVTVNPVNDAPVANAGADQIVDERAAVMLDATASSDPDGDALTYSWRQIGQPIVALSGASTAQPTFTAPNVIVATTLTFEVRVSDGVLIDADTVQVTVNPVNDPPTANAGTDQRVGFGAFVTLDGSASTDPDGDTLGFTWTQTSGANTVVLNNANTVGAAFTAPSTADILVFQLTVDDGLGGIDTAAVQVTVTDTTPPGTTFTLTGNVAVAESLLVDGDNKDPSNTVVQNNQISVAGSQAVPNPAFIGGFLGVIAQTKDISDVYRVQMAANQTATLLLADPDVNDFDLFLYDESGNPLDSSEGTGKAEQVTAPGNGTFLVEVYGFSVDTRFDPGGLYSLLIGQGISTLDQTALARHRLSSLHDFVEGEALIQYKPATPRTAQSRINAAAGFRVLNTGRNTGGWHRLRLKTIKGFARSGAAGRPPGVRPRSATIDAIKQLRRSPDVLFAQPNYIRTASATPNDQHYNAQWHYPLIGLPQAWDITTGDNSVIVAVIDTGVVLAHPDLRDQLVSGYDFISDPTVSLDGDGIDGNPDDPGDSDAPGIPSSFHGTHVAGTVAARTNNSIGVAGVAWNARIMPLRVLGKGGGSDFDIAQAIRFAAALQNVSGTVPAQKADIINMSLGGPGFSQTMADAITAARDEGLVIVTAAGNENTNGDDDSPGGLTGVVNVAAVDLDRNRASYSNFGNSIAVAAPGGDVLADRNNDGFVDGVLSTIGVDGGGFNYAFYDGTSMAAPHVAGVVALMKAVHPALSPQDVDLLLAGNHPNTAIGITDDLGTPGKDTFFGYGLVNALNAVRAAQEIAGSPPADVPILRVTPSTLDFGTSLTTADLTVTNGGTSTLAVSGATASAAWLAVAPASGGQGTYTVTVDRTGLADGVYSATIDFVSNGGNASVSVHLAVGTAPATGGDAGTLYVLLVDTTTFQTVAQDETTAAERYAFTLPDVAGGQYLLFAGTDMDDNTFIDDRGEALGGYPVLSDVETLDVAADQSALSFSVTYLVNIQNSTAAPNAPADPPSPKLRRLHRQP